jgi:hypothetical protein
MTFDEDVDHIKRLKFLNRLGPAVPAKKQAYGLTRFDVLASVGLFCATLPIAIALHQLL